MFLSLQQIAVQYPGALQRPAVDGVSLGLSRGEIGVLIGPSGCGKSSLLRCIAGLERLHAGRVEVDATRLADAATSFHLAPEARRIGMVFQDYALFPHLSVERNVGFGLQGVPPAERRARVAEVLELVGLGQHGRRAPHELSGGQQQRVALARALAPRPRLLLLDEPFSSLDVGLRERLAQELRSILQRHGTTALFVTHDQFESFALADRLGVMHEGRLLQWDTPYAVYHRPATRFVAEFVGQGVFTPGRVIEGAEAAARPDAATWGGRATTRAAEATTRAAPGLAVETALGLLRDSAGRVPVADGDGRCEVLLRADDIVHDDDSPLRGCIERKVFRGAEFLYTLRLPTGERVLALVPSHHDHQLGDWIGIRAEIDHVVTFDAAPRTAGDQG